MCLVEVAGSERLVFLAQGLANQSCHKDSLFGNTSESFCCERNEIHSEQHSERWFVSFRQTPTSRACLGVQAVKLKLV